MGGGGGGGRGRGGRFRVYEWGLRRFPSKLVLKKKGYLQFWFNDSDRNPSKRIVLGSMRQHEVTCLNLPRHRSSTRRKHGLGL